jgi:hypothetical protein
MRKRRDGIELNCMRDADGAYLFIFERVLFGMVGVEGSDGSEIKVEMKL